MQHHTVHYTHTGYISRQHTPRMRTSLWRMGPASWNSRRAVLPITNPLSSAACHLPSPTTCLGASQEKVDRLAKSYLEEVVDPKYAELTGEAPRPQKARKRQSVGATSEHQRRERTEDNGGGGSRKRSKRSEGEANQPPSPVMSLTVGEVCRVLRDGTAEEQYAMVARQASSSTHWVDGESVNTLLHLAAHFSLEVSVVQECMRQYPPAVRIPNMDGELPLHCAAREGFMAAVGPLLSAFPEALQLQDKFGETCLHNAVHCGGSANNRKPEKRLRGEEVTVLLLKQLPESKRRAYANLQNMNNESPVQLASKRLRKRMLELLDGPLSAASAATFHGSSRESSTAEPSTAEPSTAELGGSSLVAEDSSRADGEQKESEMLLLGEEIDKEDGEDEESEEDEVTRCFLRRSGSPTQAVQDAYHTLLERNPDLAMAVLSASSEVRTAVQTLLTAPAQVRKRLELQQLLP